MTKCSITRVAHFHVTDRMKNVSSFASVKDMAEHLGLTQHQLRGMLYNSAQKQLSNLYERRICIYRVHKDGSKTLII